MSSPIEADCLRQVDKLLVKLTKSQVWPLYIWNIPTDTLGAATPPWPSPSLDSCLDPCFLSFSVAAQPPHAVLDCLQSQGIAVYLLQQVHGASWLEPSAQTLAQANRQADAWLWRNLHTVASIASAQQQNSQRLRGYAFAVYTADCVPALLLCPQAASTDSPGGGGQQDQQELAGALLHLGRRGIEQRLLPHVLAALQRRLPQFCPQQVQLRLGPSIGPCCYEVPTPLAQSFCRAAEVSPHCLDPQKSASHQFLDLRRALVEQALSFGLPRENIGSPAECSSCLAAHYRRHPAAGSPCYSYRQGHQTERMYTFAVLLF